MTDARAQKEWENARQAARDWNKRHPVKPPKPPYEMNDDERAALAAIKEAEAEVIRRRDAFPWAALAERVRTEGLTGKQVKQGLGSVSMQTIVRRLAMHGVKFGPQHEHEESEWR